MQPTFLVSLILMTLMILAAGESRQLWVTLYLPESAPAGQYIAGIELPAGDGGV